MPDRRAHRGPHPRDAALFQADRIAVLRTAVDELSWLLERGYATDAALKLVGDHHQLQARQRLAVMRASAGESTAARRKARKTDTVGPVAVDGFNVLVTIEAALAGGLLLRGRDGVVRDLASVHGTWRRVAETERALDLLCAELPGAHWTFDAPVSNSGRAAAMVRARGFSADVAPSADRACLDSGRPIATGDGPLIDRAAAWVDVISPILGRLPDAWLVTLG